MSTRVIRLLSIVLTALCLGPALAHLLEMPNKLGLSRDAYFQVQQIYRGWALVGILILAAIAATAWAAIGQRRNPGVFRLSLAALGCLVAAQALFWIFTFPSNQATSNWTTPTANWEALRARWEWSHAAGAVLTLAALVLSTLSAVPREGRAEPALAGKEKAA